MHLFTHVRAKMALLFAGAFLWGAQAYAEMEVIKEVDFQALAPTSETMTYLTSDGDYVKVGQSDWTSSSVYTAEFGDMVAFTRLATSSRQMGFWLRRNGNSVGLSSQRNQHTLTITALKKGYVVTFTGQAGFLSEAYKGNTGGEWTVSTNDATSPTEYVYTMTANGDLNLLCNSGMYIYTLKVEAPIPDVYDPVISVVEGSDNTSKLIQFDCKTSTATINYTINYTDKTTESGSCDPKGQVRIYKSATSIVAKAVVNSGTDDEKTSDEVTKLNVNAGVVEKPTLSVVSANGSERTIKFACKTSGASIVLSNDEGTTFNTTIADGASVTINETTTFIARAELIDTYDASHTFYSEVLTQEVEAGKYVELAGVVPSADGNVITFTADQSSVIGTPTVTIKYTYTPVGGTEEKSGEVENGGTVELGYGTISAYAVADGYAESATFTGVYKAEKLNLVSTIDFSREAWGNHTTDLAVTYGDVAETINGIEFRPILFAGTAVENFLVKQITYLKRGGYDGLYPQSGTNIAVQNVKAGQVVVFTGRYGNGAYSLSEMTDGNTNCDYFRTKSGSVYTYECVEDGTVAVAMARYGYLEKVEVFDVVSTIDVEVTSAGYSTFFWDKPAKYDSDQVTAYTGTLSEDKKTLNLTEITTGVIPANTAVILKADEGTYTFEATEEAVTSSDNANALQGTTTDLATSEVSGTVYVLSTSTTNGVGFYKFSGETLAANKAYLVLPAAETAPMVRFNFDEGNVGNVTGIESIEAENGAQARIFDLQGRSLRQAPQKGMYILNGHKVIR
jgi:hypothetical protein